ncbi:Hypothetical protein LUCI_5205 [Lucifera butyrica]|uniref:Uncharacterized protein n=1 Tax=Lucifera butyrica TaxID=1351585 RepID=A0A498RG18_9FIRM|nr:Hypothetical protein LUCI_5205 [Lucifera butyrica]
MGTIGGAGATIVTSPSGLGAVGFGAVTAYSGGVATNSAYNFSNDFSRIFSSSGANTEGSGNAVQKVESGEQFTKVDGRKALKPNVEYTTEEGYRLLKLT